jgi:CheY-like chemotaxis protein
MRILLVEDNALLQYVHKAMLTKLQCEVDIVSSGEEALEVAKEHAYDLILLDIGLPGINGIETALKLRLLEKHAKTRLIALTAHYDGNSAEHCLSAGMEKVLSKPTDMEKLKAIIFKTVTV